MLQEHPNKTLPRYFCNSIMMQMGGVRRTMGGAKNNNFQPRRGHTFVKDIAIEMGGGTQILVKSLGLRG